MGECTQAVCFTASTNPDAALERLNNTTCQISVFDSLLSRRNPIWIWRCWCNRKHKVEEAALVIDAPFAVSPCFSYLNLFGHGPRRIHRSTKCRGPEQGSSSPRAFRLAYPGQSARSNDNSRRSSKIGPFRTRRRIRSDAPCLAL